MEGGSGILTVTTYRNQANSVGWAGRQVSSSSFNQNYQEELAYAY